MAVLRQIWGLAIDAVLNPMLASTYFICCQFIPAQWRLLQQQSFWLYLDISLELLERLVNKQRQMPADV